MRYFRYIEPRDPKGGDFSPETITLSEQEILDYYWNHWYNALCGQYGIEFVDKNYTRDHCLKDWMAVHWAWEVEDHQGEARNV